MSDHSTSDPVPDRPNPDTSGSPRSVAAVSRRRASTGRDARDQLVQLRCSSSERERWRAKAEAASVSLSVLVRDALDGAPVRQRRRTAPVDPALVREIARVGNNLNQLSKWCNRDKGGVDALLVIARLVELDRELRSIRKVASRPRAIGTATDDEVSPR